MSCENFSLDKTNYTWKNALLWGNFNEHRKAARQGTLGNRIVHALIALAELLPIIGQISSIFEKLIVAGCLSPSDKKPDLSNKNISLEKPKNADKVPSPIKKKEVEKSEKDEHVEMPKERVIAQASYRAEGSEDAAAFRKRIYHETLKACKHGYQTEKGYVKIDHDPMLRETISYNQFEPLKPAEQIYKTQFSVIAEDTFQVLLKRKAEGANPVGINMANLFHAGGGAYRGCSAQEESLCYRSNHILGLQTQPYPMPELGGIYCPHVQIFRNNKYVFLDQPQEVALVAVAAYDLRELKPNEVGDRLNFGFPRQGKLSQEDLQNCEKYMMGTKNKIRNMLRSMAMKGHTTLVLGALGCGAFENPPSLVSSIFHEIFEEPEFKGRFERVDFAILVMSASDQNNVDAFGQVCETLNK